MFNMAAPLRQLEDITGIKVTVCHEDTLHMLNEAIMIYGETRGSPGEILEDAFSKDPDFLFAQLFLVSPKPQEQSYNYSMSCGTLYYDLLPCAGLCTVFRCKNVELLQ